MKKSSFIILLLILVGLLSSCQKDIKDQKTTIEIVDNDRRYYPILRGQELDMVFYINNTGEHPLLISDIITSCGCLVVENQSTLDFVPAGKQGILRLSYDSTKNIGKVTHYVDLYGNLEDGVEEVTFQVNVVPDAHYIEDYERLYYQKAGGFKTLSDGGFNHQGYYMEEDLQ